MPAVDPGSAGEVDRSDHHKHMDYVQAVITRLANNSFLLKGWALTLSSALLGFAITQKHAGLALVALVPVLAFWVLDTYFLRQERAFRRMYADIAAKELRDFTINPTPYAEQQPWWGVGFSLSLRIYYLAIIVLTVVVAIVLALADSSSPQPSTPNLHGNEDASEEQTPSSSAVQSSQSSTPFPPPPTSVAQVPTRTSQGSIESTTAPEPNSQETAAPTQP